MQKDRGAPKMITVIYRLPKLHGKGDGAEADVVADIWLANRKISALLSQFCGALSQMSLLCTIRTAAGLSFLICDTESTSICAKGVLYEEYSISWRCNSNYHSDE